MYADVISNGPQLMHSRLIRMKSLNVEVGATTTNGLKPSPKSSTITESVHVASEKILIDYIETLGEIWGSYLYFFVKYQNKILEFLQRAVKMALFLFVQSDGK